VRSDDGHIAFRQLHARDLAPIRYERVCSLDSEPVDWTAVVRGYEYAKGKYIALTDDDFESVAVEHSQTLEILDFVKEQEIDSRFFDTPYYMVPEKGSEKAYAVLREAIRLSGMVGIGKFAMRQREQLASVKTIDSALVLEIMRFGSQLVDPSEFGFPSRESAKPRDVSMAEQLIGNLAQPFDPDRYKDEYGAELLRIIRAKLKGKKVQPDRTPRRAETRVLDLTSRLRESLDQTKRASRHAPRRPASRRAPRRPASRTRRSA
jgi:DNA end-binding protein Ku